MVYQETATAGALVNGADEGSMFDNHVLELQRKSTVLERGIGW